MSALREDAAAAANRADEARRRLATLENEMARLTSEADNLRCTKSALNAELSGLRHELNALRQERGYPSGWIGGDRRLLRDGAPAELEAMEQEQAVGDDEGTRARGGHQERRPGAALHREGLEYEREKDKGSLRETSADQQRLGGKPRAVGGSDAGASSAVNLVEVVAEFQGRLRSQVQAALAGAGSGDVSYSKGIGRGDAFVRTGRGAAAPGLSGKLVAAAVGMGSAGGVADVPRRREQDGVYSDVQKSCQNVLGELGRRVGSV